MGMKVKMFLGAQIYGETETTEKIFKGVAWDWTPGPIVETASPLGLLETLPLDHGVTTKNEQIFKVLSKTETAILICSGFEYWTCKAMLRFWMVWMRLFFELKNSDRDRILNGLF